MFSKNNFFMQRKYILIIGMCVGVYLLFAIFSINEPLIGGDAFNLVYIAKAMSNPDLQQYFTTKEIALESPPLYVGIMVLIDKIL